MPSVLGNVTLDAYFVSMRVRWPSGDTGVLMMRSLKPLLSMFATSKTSKPFAPLAV